MQIAKNRVVGIHYSIADENNEIVFSNTGFAPEEYVHGSIAVFPAIAKTLEGHEAGDELEIVLEPEKAYGRRNEQLIYEVDKKMFADAELLEEGTFIQLPGGQEALLIEKKDDSFIVDANHPLAGQRLTYNISVVSVREASEAEIKWGRTQSEINACSGQPGCC
jgi:FKBP-type peptidyl-prolyl cis-trans isomerase SlyD